MRSVAPIRTARLELVSLTPSFVEAIVSGDPAAAGRAIGTAVSPWLADALGGDYRRRELRPDGEPLQPPWLGRAMVLLHEPGPRRAVGAITFAGAPDPRGRVELAYRIEPGHRGQGYATEAIAAIFDWAARRHAVRRVAAAIAPAGDPVPLVGARLRFRDVGPTIEEIDGLEIVLETAWPPRP